MEKSPLQIVPRSGILTENFEGSWCLFSARKASARIYDTFANEIHWKTKSGGELLVLEAVLHKYIRSDFCPQTKELCIAVSAARNIYGRLRRFKTLLGVRLSGLVNETFRRLQGNWMPMLTAVGTAALSTFPLDMEKPNLAA